MKYFKYIIGLLYFFLIFNVLYAETGNKIFSGGIVIPEEMNFTERFIITELKELRVDLESQKREINKTIQDRELEAIDKALSYNANTVNFFFILMTIIVASIGLLGWKSLSDVKRTTRDSMEKETKKIILNFQNKIEELEKEQKVNILWRQFNSSENDKEKLEVLDKIDYYKKESPYSKIARSEIYLDKGLFDEVVHFTTEVIDMNSYKYKNQAFFLRACAYDMLKNKEKSVNDLKYLLQISSGYKDIIINSDFLVLAKKDKSIKEILGI